MTKEEFYKSWLKHFAYGISKREIEKYVKSNGDYIWHTFSWDLIDKNKFLVGNDARDAYNKINKRGAIYIEWFEDKGTHDITQELNTAEALDKMTEVYVVASDFSWTYIKTHENDWCGPYFMKL